MVVKKPNKAPKPKRCKDCRFHRAMLIRKGEEFMDGDYCSRTSREYFDVVEGSTVAMDLCRYHRQDFIQPGSWPAYGHCGIDAKYFLPKVK